MDLRQLEYVEALAETGSFTRAAARCLVTQSTLSSRLAALERELGVRLFERTSRSVRLSAAGGLLLPHARSVLRTVEAARDELAAHAGALTGQLQLGVLGAALQGMTFFDEALRQFRERHPGVDIVVEDSGSRHMAQRVRTGELDLAVVGLSAAQVPVELVHHLLHEDPLVAVVPRDSPLAGRAQLGLAELAASGPFIESRKESGIRLQVDTAFARAGVQRTIAFELSTPSAVPHYVGLGLGVALMPAGPAGARDDVAVVALDDPLARHPVGLVHRPLPESSPSAQAFLGLLLDHMACVPAVMPTGAGSEKPRGSG